MAVPPTTVTKPGYPTARMPLINSSTAITVMMDDPKHSCWMGSCDCRVGRSRPRTILGSCGPEVSNAASGPLIARPSPCNPEPVRG
jgi:hypothetical protein